MQKPHSALILAGHGSTLNPDSSEPTHRHAATIRGQGIFHEVHACFWKEEPSFRQVWRMIEADEIYIVPNFISEGYFTQTILPRELRLDGPITETDGPMGKKVIKYCEPVGNHANMTGLLLQRAREVAPGVDLADISLIIVGHGTGLNDNSAQAIRDQVARIRAQGEFGEVVDAFMEEAPNVADWDQMTTLEHVVVVPFFIADGLHSYEDIPVLLGIEPEPAGAVSQLGWYRQNPIELRGRKLYYASAIGTSPLLARVILDQIEAFDQKYLPVAAV